MKQTQPDITHYKTKIIHYTSYLLIIWYYWTLFVIIIISRQEKKSELAKLMEKSLSSNHTDLYEPETSKASHSARTTSNNMLCYDKYVTMLKKKQVATLKG